MKKTSKSILLFVTLITLLLLYLLNSRFIINRVIEYSLLFLTKLFPVSFIFFIMATLLIDLGLIEFLNQYLKINVSNYYILLISMISGFPSGAKYALDLYNKGLIDLETANKSIMYSHFPNPLFIMGSVNYILHDSLLALKILLAIWISNLLIFSINKKKSGAVIHSYTTLDSFSVLNKAINNSFQTMMLIYGISLFFYLISTIITKYITLSPITYILVCGIFDLTNGVFATTLINNNYIRSIFILIFICFGSISIHMQVKGIITDSPIKYSYFLLGRLFSLIISLLVFFVINLIF